MFRGVVRLLRAMYRVPRVRQSVGSVAVELLSGFAIIPSPFPALSPVPSRLLVR